MQKLRSVLVLTLLIGLAVPSFAQENRSESRKSDEGTTRGGLMLFGGLVLPSGEFGKTEGEDAGYAKSGFFGGAEIMFSLMPGLGVVLDGRYMINKLNEEEMMKSVPKGTTVSFGQYTGILPMGGLRFYTTGPVGFFIDAQAGYMFAKYPDYTMTSATGSSFKQDAANGKGLAYGGSAGIDIGNTLVVGGTYIITKPKFELTSGSGSSATTSSWESQMNTIQVWAGIRF